jgi:hypothetical protein
MLLVKSLLNLCVLKWPVLWSYATPTSYLPLPPPPTSPFPRMHVLNGLERPVGFSRQSDLNILPSSRPGNCCRLRELGATSYTTSRTRGRSDHYEVTQWYELTDWLPGARVLDKLNSHSTSQEIPRFLCNPKFHYRVHRNLSLVPILSLIHPVYNFPPFP